MEGFALPTIETRFPEMSKSCASRCPLLKSCLNSLGELDSTYDSIANRVAGDDAEAEIRAIHASMPPVLAGQFNLESSIFANRALGAEVLEYIDNLREVCEQEIKDVSEGCNGPLEAVGIDCTGRSMGVFICRSAEAPDGENTEPADVFRYPQQ